MKAGSNKPSHQFVSAIDAKYPTLRYPLLFSRGELGWDCKEKPVSFLVWLREVLQNSELILRVEANPMISADN